MRKRKEEATRQWRERETGFGIFCILGVGREEGRNKNAKGSAYFCSDFIIRSKKEFEERDI